MTVQPRPSLGDTQWDGLVQEVRALASAGALTLARAYAAGCKWGASPEESEAIYDMEAGRELA